MSMVFSFFYKRYVKLFCNVHSLSRFALYSYHRIVRVNNRTMARLVCLACKKKEKKMVNHFDPYSSKAR